MFKPEFMKVLMICNSPNQISQKLARHYSTTRISDPLVKLNST